MLLGGARRALHHLGGVPVDGGGQMLRQPGLCRSRLPDEQQGPVCHQRGDGDLHQPLVSHVFGGDLHPFDLGVPRQVSQHRPGGHPPARGDRLRLRRDQRVQLSLVKLLRRETLYVFVCHLRFLPLRPHFVPLVPLREGPPGFELLYRPGQGQLRHGRFPALGTDLLGVQPLPAQLRHLGGG